jgi:ATP/maltotriose-dependent transcriptional regulator MalT
VPRGLWSPTAVVRRRHLGRPTVDRAVSRLADRGDLLAALDRAAARKVTTISAPAGGGLVAVIGGLVWVTAMSRSDR